MWKLYPGDTVALVGSSDGLPPESQDVPALAAFLETLGLHCRVFSSLYRCPDGKPSPAAERAAHIMTAFADPSVRALFDLTGGDAANAVLPFLDFAAIAQHPKPYFGYSDVSVLLGPLQALGGVPVFYFQPRFLVRCAETQERFAGWVRHGDDSLFRFGYRFLRGECLSGRFSGGNIRCTLKLAGTPWQPEFSGHILFLESRSGGLGRIETMLHQYQQMGAFTKCNGILLGNFSELAAQGQLSWLYDIVLEMTADTAKPVAVTTQLGHQPDARCLAYDGNVGTILQKKQEM